MNSIIKVQHLTKTYKLYAQHIDRLKETLHPWKKKYHKKFNALKDVDFSIEKGEVVGIIGRNGSGKSTLLKILTGVLTPTDGSVHTRGKIAAILELGAGFNPELTGMENIYLNTTINGLSKRETDAIIEGIVEFSELGDFVHQPIKTYSSGMKSKLAFGVSISIEPDILIIDEALSVGDAAFQRKSFAKIENFRDEGKTILFVSHAASQIVELCDRAIWLHKGELILDGSSKIVTALYQKFGLGNQLDKSVVLREYKEKLLALERPLASETLIPRLNSFLKPSLHSSSMVEFVKNGASISHVQLLNTELEEVNVIAKDERYYFSYEVMFTQDVDDARATLLIKTKTGFALAGKAEFLIKTQQLKEIKKGERYKVMWKFTNILNEGSYFFNCAVNTMVEGEKVILHKILDAYMIEVIKEKGDTANSPIDLGFELSVTPLKSV